MMLDGVDKTVGDILLVELNVGGTTLAVVEVYANW